MTPLQPSAAINTSPRNIASFQKFLAENATKHPETTPTERRREIENAFEKLRMELPQLDNGIVRVAAPIPLQDTLPPASRSYLPPKRIDACYKWLISHLHNPYPTREEREELCRQSGAGMKTILAWFIVARQRIGWSQLRATRFHRSQIGMIQAASRFWPERDTHCPLPPDIELHFAEIDANAKSMYAEAMLPSTTLVQLLKKSQRLAVENSQSPTKDLKRKLDTTDNEEQCNQSHKRRRSLSSRNLASPTHGIPRRAPPKKEPHLRLASAVQPLTKVSPELSLSRRATSVPKFGESSLSPSAPKDSLKRRSTSDDGPHDTKRARLLPVWRDPRLQGGITSHPPRRRASETHQRLAKPARKGRDERSTSMPCNIAQSDPPQASWDDTFWASLLSNDTGGVQHHPMPPAIPLAGVLGDASYSTDVVSTAHQIPYTLPEISAEGWTDVLNDAFPLFDAAEAALPSLCSTPSSASTDFPTHYDSPNHTSLPDDAAIFQYQSDDCWDRAHDVLGVVDESSSYLRHDPFMLGDAGLGNLPSETDFSLSLGDQWLAPQTCSMTPVDRTVADASRPRRKRSLSTNEGYSSESLPFTKRRRVTHDGVVSGRG